MKTILRMGVLLTLVLAAAIAARAGEPSAETQPPVKKPDAPAAERPRVLVTISKETTRITEPLRKDGYVDYVAALDQRFREGVTPENNAAVPFLKAMGLGEVPAARRDEYFKMLGIPPLPEQGDYYVSVDKYIRRLKGAEKPAAGPATEKEVGEAWDQLDRAMKQPWSKKELPVMAAWLAANEKPLALVVEASKRPRRYDPLISDEKGMLVAVLLPVIQNYREAARALTARAMLRAGEGKPLDAWADLLACHRLGRLAGQGPTLVEALVAIALDSMADAGDQKLLEHARLTSAQVLKMRDDLDKLPPLPKMVDKLEPCERFMYLDCVSAVARDGLGALSMLTGERKESTLKSLMEAVARSAIDWDLILRMGNSWYDRFVDAHSRPTRAERKGAMDKIDKDIKKLAEEARNWQSLALAVLGNTREAVSQRIGEVFIALLLPAINACTDAEDRGTMQSDLTRLAFALAAYRADHSAYPAKLADLAPKYVAEVPKDIFRAADLTYKAEAGGYLLYSVGRNGKDDGGRGMDDRKEGEDWDDLAVRVPAAAQ